MGLLYLYTRYNTQTTYYNVITRTISIYHLKTIYKNFKSCDLLSTTTV
jgi:hypothetical protein